MISLLLLLLFLVAVSVTPSPTSTSSTSSPPHTPGSTATPTSESGLTSGEITGIILASLFGVLIILVILITIGHFVKKRLLKMKSFTFSDVSQGKNYFKKNYSFCLFIMQLEMKKSSVWKNEMPPE